MRETLVFLLLIIIGLAVFVLVKEERQKTAPSVAYTSESKTFYCPDDGSFSVQYDDGKTMVRLSFSGVRYELERKETELGVVYVDVPNGAVFSEQPGEARFRLASQDAELVCHTKPVQKPSAQRDLIRVSSPAAGALVSSPIKLEGEARGLWFFEASAPVAVSDDKGRVIGQGFVTAGDEWMTEDFVPFSGSVLYNLPINLETATGTVTFIKENPSGLPQNDAAFTVPVMLGQTETVEE